MIIGLAPLKLKPNCIFSILHAAIHCPVIPVRERASVSSTNTRIGAVVTVECAAGMRMVDGSARKTVTCTETGEWTDSVTDCGSGLVL